jgi:DNA repair photolyase
MSLRPVSNPPNRFHAADIEWIDAPPPADLEVYEERAKSILSENDSPDIPFRYSLNPYRGCFHGCAYCYARASHQYLDFGAGTDFERKLVVKVNAPELLEHEFWRPKWSGHCIIFSGNTDCYQPLESHYRLTRRCLEVCARFKNQVALVTKGALVCRDVDVLVELRRNAAVQVTFSVAFSDDDLAQKLEAGAPRPSTRFRAMAELSAAGIPVAVAVAPVIPGLNEQMIPEILERAAASGAESAFMSLVRLPAEVKDVFLERLHEAVPSRERRVLHSIMRQKGGRLNRSEFGERMTGTGPEWQAIEWMLEANCERLGLNQVRSQHERPETFERPIRQLTLF